LALLNTRREKSDAVVGSTLWSSTNDAIVLYPGDALLRQASRWARRHPASRLRVYYGRALPEIRQSLDDVDAVVIDATEDDAQAVDALLQAVACRGPDSVVVYTETMHEGLELFVRVRGVPLVLGPLDEGQWDALLASRMSVAVGPRRKAA